jgi:hypothetical protein
VSTGDRAGAMADRIERAARDAGLSPSDVSRVVEAVRRAMAKRAACDDPAADPLHPGRNVLILLEDAGVRDSVELAAAAWYDALVPPQTTPEDAEVDWLLQATPHPDRGPDAERFLEDLLVADAAARRIAIADALDHARHLHLRPADTWAGLFKRVRDVHLPLAERTDAVLAGRLRWWTGMFAERWLPLARP